MKVKFLHFLLFFSIGLFASHSFSQNPNWAVNPSDYQYSMTLTTFLNVNGNTLKSTNDKVVVFVNNEIRGVANVTFEASENKYIAYLSAYANTNNETLTFKVYDSTNDAVVNISKTINFQIDGNVGSVFKAVSLANPALNNEANLLDFNFKNSTPNSISKNGNIYNIEVPAGTNVTNLIPEFSLSNGANVFVERTKQISGISAIDFTNSVNYIVLSEDESVQQNYIINVTIAVNEAATTVLLATNSLLNINQIPVEISVKFSNNITGFNLEDFQLINAVVSKFTKIDNQNYTIEVVPIIEGSFSVEVLPNAVLDEDNKANFSSNVLTFTFDNTKPIITDITYDIESGNEFFDITFSEEISNQDINDFDLTGTNANIYLKNSFFRVKPNVYRLSVFRIDNNPKPGSIFVKINADTDITDLGNNKLVVQKFEVFFRENQPPIVPILPDIIAECNVIVTDVPNTTDAISGEILGTTTDVLNYNQQGEYTITWTFKDEANNTSIATQKVIVKDITLPIAPTLPIISDECSASVTTTPTATDNCAGTITGTTTDALTYTTQGEHLITWNFDDGNGNIAKSIQKVIIKDITFPALPTLPDIRAVNSVTLTAPKAQDNCGEVVDGITFDPVFYDKPGQYLVYWFFDDASGNSIRGTQNVFIFDGNPTAPILSDLKGDCSVTVFNIPTLETIDGTIKATTTDTLNYTDQGEFIITWVFDLGNGTQITSTQKVIVKDEIAPEAPFLNDVTSECSYTFSEIPTTFDGCAALVTATTSDPLTYTEAGNYTITWSFDDGNGNIATSTQNIIITDTLAPVKPILSDVNAQCSVTLVPPTTTDNCRGVVTATTTNPLFYNVAGTYTVNWVFDDGNGNSTTALQNVIIDNSFTPIAPILPDVITECAVVISDIPETQGNGCTGKVVATTADSLTYNTQGEYTIVWTFDYGNGIVLKSYQKVIIKDETAPIIPVLQEITSECSITISDIPTTTDNCAGTITGTTTDNLTYNQQGEFIITWSFDDGNGNTSTVNQKVIIDDTTAPEIKAKDFELELDDIGNATLEISDINDDSIDNCGIISYNLSKTNFTEADLGENDVVFTVTDVNGNSDFVNLKITVTQKALSTENIELKNLIQLYPNPVNRKLFIKIDEKVKINKIEIFSVNGKTILSTEKSQNFIDVKHFAIGVYFIKINTEKGYLLKKFIKAQH